MPSFRILSLDGGGIKGTFTASVAANLEQLTGKRLVDHFDLIAGTSTGGIIALGLGLGVSATEILEFYCDRGPRIFRNTGANRWMLNMRHALFTKFSQGELRSSLEEVFGTRKLGESQCRLVIPSYDCNAGRVQLFKTAHHKRFIQDYRVSAVDVAMATAAAPTYFPAFTGTTGQAFLDGGVWANCPVVVALLEAVFVLGYRTCDVEILSIGTTDTPFDISKRSRVGGFLSWNYQIVTLLMQAQVDVATGQARIITGRKICRVDAVTRPGRFTLDDARRIEELRGLGARHAREAVEEVDSRFLNSTVRPFTPCYDAATNEPLLQDPPSGFIARRRRRRSLGVARTAYAAEPYKILNISCTGALLETDGAIEVGSFLDLAMELEDLTRLELKARVVRVQEPRWGIVGGVGVQFVGVDGTKRRVIERYVDEGAVTNRTAAQIGVGN